MIYAKKLSPLLASYRIGAYYARQYYPMLAQEKRADPAKTEKQSARSDTLNWVLNHPLDVGG